MAKIIFKNTGEPTGNPPAGWLWLFMDSSDNHLKQKDENGIVIDVTESATNINFPVKKATSGTLAVGKAIYLVGSANGTTTVELAKANSESTMPSIGLISTVATDSVEGIFILSGKLIDVDTSAWNVGDELYIDALTAGELTNVKPIGATNLIHKIGEVQKKDATEGIIFIHGAGRTNDLKNLTQDKVWVGDTNGVPEEVDKLTLCAPYLDFFNGSIQETFDALVTSNGSVITMSLEQTGGGDLTLKFSDGETILDCTPVQTIALTAGTVISPQENYIYIPLSTKVLTKSTTNWPATEHIKIGYFFVQTATFVQSDGALINQNWNDHISGTNLQGHMLHIAENIRRRGTCYFSGLAGEGSDDYTTSSAGTVTVQTGAGVIYQMHKQIIPAKDTSGSNDAYILNGHAIDGDAYFNTQNLYDITVDTTGASLDDKFFNVVLWGVANKIGAHAPLMINIPSGSYANLSDAQNDVGNYDVFAMPREFNRESSTGFLIARLTFKKESGSWTYHSTVDLRGQTPASAIGGTAGGSITEFSDNLFRIFNNVDATKKINVDASGIATGNTRTITMADDYIDLADIILNNTHRASTDNPHNIFQKFQFFSDQFDTPVNADWAVNDIAPSTADSNNAGLSVRLFDDTTEEGVGFILNIPSGAMNIKFTLQSRAETTPGGAETVALSVYEREIPNNSAVTVWSSAYDLTDIDIPTNENFQTDTQTISLATLGLTAGSTHQLELTRDTGDAGDTLTGDWALLMLKVEFS